MTKVYNVDKVSFSSLSPPLYRRACQGGHCSLWPFVFEKVYFSILIVTKIMLSNLSLIVKETAYVNCILTLSNLHMAYNECSPFFSRQNFFLSFHPGVNLLEDIFYAVVKLGRWFYNLGSGLSSDRLSSISGWQQEALQQCLGTTGDDSGQDFPDDGVRAPRTSLLLVSCFGVLMLGFLNRKGSSKVWTSKR